LSEVHFNTHDVSRDNCNSGMLCRVISFKLTDVSEVPIASVIRES
jgi:hypothetical protein